MGERKRGRGEEPSENAGGQEDGSNGIMQDDTDMGTVTAEEQRKQYLAAEQGVQLEVGEEWFVVDHRWLKRFKKYTQIIDQDNEPPPPEEIDQRAIVIVPTLRRGSAATDFDETQDFVHALRKQGDAVPVMRDELCSGRDFELVTQAQWALLVKWYGGGPAIPRKVQQGDRVFVDLYPLQVWVQTGKRGEPRAMLITRTRTMSLFVSDLLENLPDGECGSNAWRGLAGSTS
ncbi:peptidase C19, ubiquitin-specific peptidase [Baffinella frigidus]|nr:peptidase C19, ubiquitin-specific peptidase [Cryptophyta sp. CCMP2293]